jgi:hypothetical protein
MTNNALKLACELISNAREAALLDPNGEVFYEPPSFINREIEQSTQDNASVTPGERIFKNRYVDALLLQYEQLPSHSNKDSFVQALVARLRGDPIACATLIRLNRFQDISRTLASYINFAKGYVQCLEIIRDTLRYEPHLLAGELDSVKQMSRAIINELDDTRCSYEPELGHREVASQLLRLVAEVPFATHVRQLRESDNPEINTDQERVKETVHRLGLDPDLALLLSYVEELFESGDSEFDFAVCLDRLRAFYERLVTGLVPIVERFSGKPFRENRANDGQCLRYLNEAGILTPSEKRLFERFYGFLSAEGSHAASADREQARIAKNILVELAWLSMQRVQGAHDAAEQSV